MNFSEEALARYMPDIDEPMSEEDYLRTYIPLSGQGKDFGEAVSYDPAKEKEYDDYIESSMRADV